MLVAEKSVVMSAAANRRLYLYNVSNFVGVGTDILATLRAGFNAVPAVKCTSMEYAPCTTVKTSHFNPSGICVRYRVLFGS